jgi:hypothetical protein
VESCTWWFEAELKEVVGHLRGGQCMNVAVLLEEFDFRAWSKVNLVCFGRCSCWHRLCETRAGSSLSKTAGSSCPPPDLDAVLGSFVGR